MPYLLVGLLIAIFGVAADSYASALTPEQALTADLNRQLPAYEQTEQTVNGSTFLLLQRENMTSFTKGTAILVPDWSQHAASPKHIDHLRQQLNDYGWHTLAIMPPSYPEHPLTEDSLQQYQLSLKARMETVQRTAEQQPGVSIVIAQGSSAAVLNRLYADKQLQEPAAFIMLGAYLPDQELNRQLAKAMASHQIPTLDINHQYDNQYVSSQLKLRQQLAKKQLKAIYRQRQIVGSGYHYDEQEWVLQEIYGWLTSVGL